MLNAVLEKLGNLVPKGLIVAAFFPLVIFVSVNGALLWATSGTFRLMVSAMSAGSVASLTSRALLGVLLIVALTYALSSLQPWLRETLEGSNWPDVLARPFRRRQWGRWQRRHDEMVSALQRRDALVEARADWDQRLRAARDLAKGIAASTFRQLSPVAAKALRDAERLVAEGGEVPQPTLETIVKELETEIPKNSPKTLALKEVRGRFNAVVKHAVERSAIVATRAYTRFNTNFAVDDLAPTAIGNVAATIVSYAYGRYNFNVEMLWTRLQKVMQSDAGFYAAVQDSKVQLDFVVGMFYALLVSTVFWLFALPLVTESVLFYLVVSLAFALTCALAYAVVLVSYRAFADLIRSSVDLYRFALADALHFHKPPSLTAERKLWDAIDQNMAYGGNIDLPYEHR